MTYPDLRIDSTHVGPSLVHPFLCLNVSQMSACSTRPTTNPVRRSLWYQGALSVCPLHIGTRIPFWVTQSHKSQHAGHMPAINGAKMSPCLRLVGSPFFCYSLPVVKQIDPRHLSLLDKDGMGYHHATDRTGSSAGCAKKDAG